MRFSQVLATSTFVAGIHTVCARDAPTIKDNIPGVYLQTHTDGKAPGNNGLTMEIVASTSSDGEGVEMTINLNGGPTRIGGPFCEYKVSISMPAISLLTQTAAYHIHEKAVPSDGNCAAIMGHLDPFSRGETPPCNPLKPEKCQIGDLSGKHGDCVSIPGCTKRYISLARFVRQTFVDLHYSFRDKFLSLTPGNPAFIGDKSFALHYHNKTRISCINFTMHGLPTNPSPSSLPGNPTIPQAPGESLSSFPDTTAPPSNISSNPSMPGMSPARPLPSPIVTIQGSAPRLNAIENLATLLFALVGVIVSSSLS